jgi:hypothetical protein
MTAANLMRLRLSRAATNILVGWLLIVLAGGVSLRSVRHFFTMALLEAASSTAPAQAPHSQEEETEKENEGTPARAARRAIAKHIHQRTSPVCISWHSYHRFACLTATAPGLVYRDGAGAFLRC